MLRSLFGQTDADKTSNNTSDMNGTGGTGKTQQGDDGAAGVAAAASAQREAIEANKGGFFKLNPAEVVAPGECGMREGAPAKSCMRIRSTVEGYAAAAVLLFMVNGANCESSIMLS